MRSIIRRTAGIVTLLTLPTLLTVGMQQTDAHQSHPVMTVTTVQPGDDNGDGVIMEDESGFDCHTMGNRVCGSDMAPVAAVKKAKRPTLAQSFKACTERAYRDGREVRKLSPVPTSALLDCLELGLRPARTINSASTDPWGPVLVRECRDQGYTRVELADCLTQE